MGLGWAPWGEPAAETAGLHPCGISTLGVDPGGCTHEGCCCWQLQLEHRCMLWGRQPSIIETHQHNLAPYALVPPAHRTYTFPSSSAPTRSRLNSVQLMRAARRESAPPPLPAAAITATVCKLSLAGPSVDANGMDRAVDTD